MSDIVKQYPAFIASLLHPKVYDHSVGNIELKETHISWVILTGTFAYKIKKPVDFGFLNFSTLEKRHFYCDEELRLNSRLAPSIYLEVVSIKGPDEEASFSGTGEIIEYAVKMTQFPQDMQFDNMLNSGLLKLKHMQALANLMADFHQQTKATNRESNFGEPRQVYKPVRENFPQYRPMVTDKGSLLKLAEIEKWSSSAFEQLKPLLRQRKTDGFIRECHGDLHLRNLVLLDDSPVAFDCIEFDPELRWIDTINDVAFLIMDLQERQQTEFAHQFLNTYLEKTGDYSGTRLVQFYLIYRALVRAKVEALSANMFTSKEYLELAYSYLQVRKPMLIITCGMSASGKSTLTQPLINKLSAIRIRSDVERKRLFNSPDDTNSSAAFNSGIYSIKSSQKIYYHLAEKAGFVLEAGYPVIVDAACLKSEQREILRQVAINKGLPFVILEFTAQADTLRQRINDRVNDVSDADQSILEQQLINFTPLDKEELSNVIAIDTESTIDMDDLVASIRSRLLSDV